MKSETASFKICIPIPYQREGGMHTFMYNFRNWLDGQGIGHTDDPQANFDILLVNSWAVPYQLVRQVKTDNPSVRIVQRVDGSARDYGRFDDADDCQARVNMLADLTIMQSEYSRFSTTQKFRLIRQSGPVIYNPVDVDLFHPNSAPHHLQKPIRICNASFSLGKKKGTWQIGDLACRNPDITFVLCGRYPPLPDLPNIELLGHLDRPALAAAMRSCHLFMHLAENDPCPNVVLEGLASGLPVLYIDSGGTPELVADCGLPMTIDAFRSQVEAILERHGQLAQAARTRAETNFNPDLIFKQYLEAFAQAKRRSLPTYADFIAASRQGYPVIAYRPRQLYWLAKRWLSQTVLRRSARL